MGIEFNTQQIYALYDIENWWYKCNEQVFEISGPAGSGKTTLVRYAIERIGLDITDVAFVAYAGKASIQLARNGLPAQTIHSLIYVYEKVLDLDENGKIQVDNKGKPKMTMQFTLKPCLPKHIKLIVLDEASMVNKDIKEDLLSFGLPLMALGDLNQLPPVFGDPAFLRDPDVVLTQVMRQAENNPIIWLSQRILKGEPLQIGKYGNSYVAPKSDLNDFALKNSDVVLTCTNRLRHKINDIFREQIYAFKKLDIPHEGEKIICRKNNWQRCIDGNIFLANGMSGFIDYVDMESYNNKTVKIDFRPDFIKKKFKNVAIDYKRLFSNGVDDDADKFSFTRDKFEFGYAITTHLSQGSQYPKALFLSENGTFDKETYKRLMYTAVTRAVDSIGIYE